MKCIKNKVDSYPDEQYFILWRYTSVDILN